DLVLDGEDLRGLAHQHFRHRAEESVAIHAVDEFLIAETISPASAVKIVGKARHRFSSARQYALEVASSNFLKAERDGLQARRARLIDRVGRNLLERRCGWKSAARDWGRLQPAGRCRRSSPPPAAAALRHVRAL